MALDAAFVTFAMELCTGRKMNVSEAKDLAIVLESREELLAHLLIRTDFLSHHLDIRTELLRIAGENGYEAQTRRAALGPSAATNGLNSILSSEIAKVIAEAELLDSVSQLDSLTHRLNQVRHHPEANSLSAPERWIKS